MKRKFFLSVVILVALSVVALAYPERSFLDVPEGAWYASSVAGACELGLLKGKTETEFAPDENVTVAEVIALSARLHSNYHNGHADFVQGTPWYQVYVDYALENSILTAGDFTEFNQPATRGETARLLAHAYPAEALPAMNTVVFSAIPDVTVTDAYWEEIYTLYRAGIVTGSDELGTYHPNDLIARREIAAIALRMADPTVRKSITLDEAADQPDTFRHGFERGVETVYACYSTYFNSYNAVPLPTGLPKLTNAEIDWLIEQNNPKLAAEAITTFADCGNYFARAQFMDYDSNLEIGEWFTHLCGEQVVARKGGFCGAMCNATAYLLRDDYDELHFVLIDGHVMLCLKTEGIYYLIEPVSFLFRPGVTWNPGYFNGYLKNVTLFADNMQVIADSMVAAGHTKTFHTYPADHDMLPQMLQYTDRGTDWVYPTGSEVTCWTPDTSSVSYKDVSPDYPYDWRTNCWMSESVVTPVYGIESLPLPDYPGMF